MADVKNGNLLPATFLLSENKTKKPIQLYFCCNLIVHATKPLLLSAITICPKLYYIFTPLLTKHTHTHTHTRTHLHDTFL